jgi:hypothetical protein
MTELRRGVLGPCVLARLDGRPARAMPDTMSRKKAGDG